MIMILNILILLIGLSLLLYSADKVVIYSDKIAKYHNLSPLLIGLTVVAFGTSAPASTARWRGCSSALTSPCACGLRQPLQRRPALSRLQVGVGATQADPWGAHRPHLSSGPCATARPGACEVLARFAALPKA